MQMIGADFPAVLKKMEPLITATLFFNFRDYSAIMPSLE